MVLQPVGSDMRDQRLGQETQFNACVETNGDCVRRTLAQLERRQVHTQPWQLGSESARSHLCGNHVSSGAGADGDRHPRGFSHRVAAATAAGLGSRAGPHQSSGDGRDPPEPCAPSSSCNRCLENVPGCHESFIYTPSLLPKSACPGSA